MPNNRVKLTAPRLVVGSVAGRRSLRGCWPDDAAMSSHRYNQQPWIWSLRRRSQNAQRKRRAPQGAESGAITSWLAGRLACERLWSTPSNNALKLTARRSW